MAVVTLQMFSPTVGKSQCSYALWDMTYVMTNKNKIYGIPNPTFQDKHTGL